eukprot:1333375-Amorphochlora_amoeboformis.AAC.1
MKPADKGRIKTFHVHIAAISVDFVDTIQMTEETPGLKSWTVKFFLASESIRVQQGGSRVQIRIYTRYLRYRLTSWYFKYIHLALAMWQMSRNR